VFHKLFLEPSGSQLKKEKVMNKKMLFALLAVLLGAMLCTSCGGEKSDGPDLTRGLDPIFGSSAREAEAIDAMRFMTPQERAASIESNFPQLERRIIAFLKDPRLAKHVGAVGNVTKIAYVYANEVKGVKATDGKGELHEGYINGELIARVYFEGRKEPFNVAIRCTNGLLDILDKDLQPIVEVTKLPAMKFTIEKGESLCSHVDYSTAVQVGEKFGLRILKREVGSKVFRSLTYEEARSLVNDTDRVMVQVLVMPGDTFDLATMTMVR
jgi:hypothetical protein